MGKKKKVRSRTLLLVVLVLVAFGLLALNSLFFDSSRKSTGYSAASFATVGFSILGEPDFTLLSPENITYNFSIGELLFFGLNGSSNAPFESWVYHLYDARHNRWVAENVSFGISNSYFPNQTFEAVRWDNLLFVEGVSGANTITKNVTFFVFVPNSAPILGVVENPLYVCEGESFLYRFNATDVDEDFLSVQLNTTDPFFVDWSAQDLTLTNFTLYSGVLLKGPGNEIGLNQGSRSYPLRLEVSDGNYSDTADTTVTILEINNPPRIVPALGVQTIWNRGENSTLFIDVNFTDVETQLGWGTLTPSLTIANSTGDFVSLFTMDANGIINFTANENVTADVYNVSVCVSDSAIANPSALLSGECGQNGGVQTTCDWFGLTVTDANRAPTIVSHSPPSENVTELSSTQRGFFNITTYDPDGTIPDAYFFVDGVLSRYVEGLSEVSFNYTFGCGISGNHRIRVDITDGELNDTLTWNVSVSLVSCPKPAASGGGGGGGGGALPQCSTQWACTSWNVCQHADTSLENGVLSREDYRFIKDQCDALVIYDDRCGFQIRLCDDVNLCNLTINKPLELQACLFTQNPSCDDGIQNCHDGSCELLVDCGGPCGACASCTDNVRNQGEEGVDCGGPCPWQCEPAIPLLKRSYTIYVFLGVLAVIIGFVAFKLVRVLRYQRVISSSIQRS